MGRPRAAAWVAVAFALSAAGSRLCNTSEVVVLEEGSPVGCVRRSYFDEHAEPPVTLRFSGTDVEYAVDEATLQCREGTSVFERKGGDNAWLMRSAILVLSMQGGFGLLEASMVRDDNVASIMAKNVLDLILGSVAFFLYGYQLAFGERRKGAALKWCFGSLWPVRFARDPVDFMFHFSFAATASTIDSGCVAARFRR